MCVHVCPGHAGVKHKTTMTVEDCFELGKVAYTDADYYHTELWMAQALNQMDQGEQSATDKVNILDYLSYSIYQQGELDKALELTRRLLKLGKNWEDCRSLQGAGLVNTTSSSSSSWLVICSYLRKLSSSSRVRPAQFVICSDPRRLGQGA